MNTKLAMVLALVFGFIAAIAVKSWITEESIKQKAEAEPLAILVANKRLTKGTVLKMQDCKQSYIAKNFVTAGMIPYADRMRYADRMLTRDIDTGAPVFEDFLEDTAGARSIARLVVQPNNRAITLQVDQVSGVAGLIRPGDYVDVIGTFIDDRQVTAPAPAGSGRNTRDTRDTTTEKTTKTVYLLQAVRVLAIDNKVISADMPAAAANRGSYRTVTLEVRPDDALRLISANHAGNLQLLLRNPGEANLVDGIQEIEQNKKILQQKPTLYWDITDEIFRTTPNSR